MRSVLALAFASSLVLQSGATPVPEPGGRPVNLVAREVAYSLDERQLDPVSHISWSPKIYYPTEDAVWRAGQEAYVTWNGTLPSDITVSQVNNNGTLLLGHNAPGDLYLNLDVEHPLGTGIPLYTGKTNFTFTVPADLPTRTDYIVVLIGSSGNRSERFTILGANSTTTGTASQEPTSASAVAAIASPTSSSLPAATAVAALQQTQSATSSAVSSRAVTGSSAVLAALAVFALLA